MNRFFACVVLILGLPVPVWARTIVITDEDCEKMAVICANAPKLSWAAYEASPGVWTTKYSLDLRSSKSFLILFPLDKLPKGQRITNAELVIPVSNNESWEQRLTLRRILGEWGPGVSYQHRRQHPKAVEWTKPGAMGLSSDCAAKPTAVVRITARGEKSVNVTEDVELWYTGAATNQGWLLRLEDDRSQLHLISPLSTYPDGRATWKLRITYEPLE